MKHQSYLLYSFRSVCMTAIVFSGLLLSVDSVSGQTLQFSRALLVSSVQTVPEGHVWKVESCLGPRTESGGGSNAETAPANHNIQVNGSGISVATNGYGTVGTSGGSTGYYIGSKTEVCTTMPIWLPAGTTLAVSTNVNFISVIEFEIVE